MLFKITLLYFITSLFCCVHSLYVLEGNTTKAEPKKSPYSSCYSCTKYNQACIDGLCYCANNYKKDSYGKCVFNRCEDDSDCKVFHDYYRHCDGYYCVCDNGYYEDFNNGRKCTLLTGACTGDSDCKVDGDFNRHCSDQSCVCDYGYSKDWNNDGKCTYDTNDTYYDTYHVSVWTWAWVFILIPVIAISICVRLRCRRMSAVQQVVFVQPQPQFNPMFPPPPPPYTTHDPQQQQPATVYRY